MTKILESKDRRLLFTDCPASIEGVSGLPDQIEIELHYTDRFKNGGCTNGIVLDNVIIPTIVKACNEHEDLKQLACKLMRALEDGETDFFELRDEFRNLIQGGAIV